MFILDNTVEAFLRIQGSVTILCRQTALVPSSPILLERASFGRNESGKKRNQSKGSLTCEIDIDIDI